ncbi:MAG: N-6 DNA methylase [Spirochaetales bacterium]|nr:N-6 DNA methylase [Spirochaetales bacterium]
MNKAVQNIKDSLNISHDAPSAALITYLIVLYKILLDFEAEREYLRAPHLITQYLDKLDFEKLEDSPTVGTMLDQLSPLEVNVFKETLEKYSHTVSLEKALGLLSKIDFSKDIIRGNYDVLLDRFLDIQEHLIDDLGSYYAVNTPRSVISILKGILAVKEDETCLDPCIGYGDLVTAVGERGKSISGQDSNALLAAIAKNNTIVAGKESFIKKGDSVSSGFEFDPCDVVVGHYHFDFRFDSDPGNIPEYMEWGIPSRSGSDFYFISLILHYMKKRGATIVPEGLLFRSGKEGEIRRNMIERDNLIDCVISLPPGLFKLSGVAASLLIFNREKKDRKILMIDGREFYKKIRGGALIDEEGINRIIEIYRQRKDIRNNSQRLITEKDLKESGYVLSVNRYVTPVTDPEPANLEGLEKSVIELEQAAGRYRKSVNEKLKRL